MSAVGTGWRVERFGAEAAALVSALHGRCFAEAWSCQSMAAFLSAPGSAALLASAAAGEAPAGFALARAVAGEAELVSLGVVRHHRRRGCARALLGAVVAWAEAQSAAALFLEVESANRAALALYGEFGFAVVGRRAGYYRLEAGRRGDALSMRRSLRPNEGRD